MTRGIAPGVEIAASTLLLVLVALLCAWFRGPAVAVYTLSFWHYLFYWGAYRHGLVTARRLRRDAGLLKGLALAAFAYAWSTAPSTWPAMIMIAAGFGVNGVAAWRLGADRTYYGWELGEVPYRHVASFPYSLLSHPMLVGNVIAFAGPLSAPAFRAAWWPLALLHVVLNLGLMLMETHVSPSAARATRQNPRSHEPHSGGLMRHAIAAAGGALLGGVAAQAAAPSADHGGTWPAALGAVVGLQWSVVSVFYLPWPSSERAGARGGRAAVRNEVSP